MSCAGWPVIKNFPASPIAGAFLGEIVLKKKRNGDYRREPDAGKRDQRRTAGASRWREIPTAGETAQPFNKTGAKNALVNTMVRTRSAGVLPALAGGARRTDSNAHKRQKNLVLGRSRQPVSSRTTAAKFPSPVAEVMLFEVIEIIPITNAARDAGSAGMEGVISDSAGSG